jgi:hypothetical protein
MPPRKTRLRKREPTPEPSEDEQSVSPVIEDTNTSAIAAESQISSVDAPPIDIASDSAQQIDNSDNNKIVDEIDDDDINIDDNDNDDDDDEQRVVKKSKSSTTTPKARPAAAAADDDVDDIDDDLVARSVRSNQQAAAAAAAAAASVATPAGPLRRLMIKEMVLENFKSYAGAQLIGPFHKVRRSSLFCCFSVFFFFF